MIVAAPMNEAELRNMLYTAVNTPAPFAIRYPRGCGEGVEWKGKAFESVAVGRGRKLKEGSDVAVLSIGTTGNFAAAAIQKVEQEHNITVAHYDMRFSKPLDEALLDEVGKRFKRVVTVEDGVLRGGVGEAVAHYFNEKGYDVNLCSLGIDDKFVEQGTPAELYAQCGYDAAGIEQTILNIVQ
jgi:1-deoxy-D-xylulose-5-phosphate synthase